jgi:hypothetical protein
MVFATGFLLAIVIVMVNLSNSMKVLFIALFLMMMIKARFNYKASEDFTLSLPLILEHHLKKVVCL